MVTFWMEALPAVTFLNRRCVDSEKVTDVGPEQAPLGRGEVERKHHGPGQVLLGAIPVMPLVVRHGCYKARCWVPLMSPSWRTRGCLRPVWPSILRGQTPAQTPPQGEASLVGS
jgi:hypothetical protein